MTSQFGAFIISERHLLFFEYENKGIRWKPCLPWEGFTGEEEIMEAVDGLLLASPEGG